MIKVIGHSQEGIEYSVVYNRSARVLDIESSCMNDDCIPYRESTGCMAWLSKHNILCEIECIFPIESEEIGDWIGQDVKTLAATPVLKVSFEQKSVEVFIDGTQLILILNKNKKADRRYISSSIAFYVSGDELAAIACTDFQVS